MTWRGRGRALRKRYGSKKGSNELTPFQREQLKIARETLSMPDEMVAAMGGMTKAQAREIIHRLTGKR